MALLQINAARTQFMDANGVPLVAGTVTTYIPGTTTSVTTYEDSGAVVANTNPITLDSIGSAAIWAGQLVRMIVKDALGNQIYDQVGGSILPDAVPQPTFDITRYGAIGNGTRNDNDAFEACCNAAAAAGGWVWLNGDSNYLIGNAASYTIPAGLKGIISNGATLTINPSISYTDPNGFILLCAAPDCNLDNLNINCDSTVFADATTGLGKTILTIIAPRVTARNMYFYGCAQSFVYIFSGSDFAEITGTYFTTSTSFHAVFISGSAGTHLKGIQAHHNRVVGSNTGGRSYLKSSGVAAYYSDDSQLDHNIVNYSSAGFGVAMNGCLRGSMASNVTLDTFLEGVQATLCTGVTISQNDIFYTQTTDGTRVGYDMGLSIDGCKQMMVLENTITGSWASAIGVASDSGISTANLIRNNKAYNCAYETTNGNIYFWPFRCYTSSLPGTGSFTNTGNIFDGNFTYNDTGKEATYPYYEYTGGSGATCGINAVRRHDYSGCTGIITVLSTTNVWDLYMLVNKWTPTISNNTGTGTWSVQSAVNANYFKRDGDLIDVYAYLQATLSGSSGAIPQINLPYAAIVNEPVACYLPSTGNILQGRVNGQYVIFRNATNGTPVSDGTVQIEFKARYRIS